MSIAEITTNTSPQNNGPLKGKCCSKPGDAVKGTFFFGGAGIEGSYINSVVVHLKNAGIKSAVYVDRDKWSQGSRHFDASIGVIIGRDFDPKFPMLLRVHDNAAPQFNLIGYSYGSILAAQIAMKYANGGTKVDNLVLIGSPISSQFLYYLRSSPNIRKIIPINLDDHGDPIYPGMHINEMILSTPEVFLQMKNGTGHFYYSIDGEEGEKRRKNLAEFLYKAGVR